MTDKEQLELAAKAAGVPIDKWHDSANAFVLTVCERSAWWNPLADDGDALRLAVRLKIDLSIYNGGVQSVWVDEDLSEAHETWEACDENFEGWEAKQLATRRAIVRAAAEIGKEMP